MRRRSVLGSPLVAAALSFLFPGLGQAAAGKPRRGAIVAVPALAVLGVFLLIGIFDRASLLGLALNDRFLTSLLILNAVAFIYHVWAVVDAYLLAARAQPSEHRAPSSVRKWAATLGVVVIVSGTVGVHAGVAATGLGWQHALYCLTAETPCWVTDNPPADTSAPTDDIADNPDPTDTGSPGPSESQVPLTTFDLSSLPSFEVSTDRTDWSTGQLNVLLIGSDSGPQRSGLRPDTMIVLHVDIATRRAAMIGVGRNNVCVPLPGPVAQHYATSRNGCPAYTWSGRGGIATGQLNWLAQEAMDHPENFPGYPQGDGAKLRRGALATEQAIGTLLGLTMDGFVMIDLEGLATLIDDLGGIDINVPTRVFDEPCGPKGSWQAKWYVCADAHNGYNVPVPNDFSAVQRMIDDAAKSGGKQSISWHSGTSKYGTDIAFTIQPGVQHMTGQWALAYARSRKYSSDFDRMQRQQIVLKAMRTGLADPCSLLPRLPDLIGHIGGVFNSNLPLNDAGAVRQFAGLARLVAARDVPINVLDPKTAGQSFIGGYPAFDATSWAKVKNIVAHSLDNVAPGTGSDGSGGGGGFSC